MKLLSEHEDVLAEFNSGQVAVPADSDDGGWIEVSLESGGWRAGPGREGRDFVETPPTGLVGGASLDSRRDPEQGCCAEKSRGLEESQGAGVGVVGGGPRALSLTLS